MDMLLSTLAGGAKWILPVLSIWLLVRCVRSMLQEKYQPEIWAYIEDPGGQAQPLYHWENIIGRSKSSDIVISASGVSRTHAALIRSGIGKWKIYDLESKGGVSVRGQSDEGHGLALENGDCIYLGGVETRFFDLNDAQLAALEKRRNAPGTVSPAISLLILSLIQTLLALEFTVSAKHEYLSDIVLGFVCVMALGWFWYLIMRALDRTGFEVEIIAFFLCTLGIAIVATASPEDMLKQIILLLAGVFVYIVLGWWLRDIRRAKSMRWPLGLLALGFLALNLVAGITSYGALNWLKIGGFTIQPSEFVKIAYIYTGTATLDRLFRGRNLFMFIAFSAVCVCALALMGDFGTALIFFTTFLIISFLRSGSFATVFLAVAGAALAVMLVLTVKPYVAQRFATWGHVWEDPYDAGWQQASGLSAAASGGLFGIGAGKGWCKNIFAADTDMVFCVLSEELGLLIALAAMLAVVVLAFFAVRSAAAGRSSFYAIAACAAASMMMVQLALNCFGCVDILPFTGVTFPFVSKGGSSLISCWGLLAFIKAADNRHGASFSVKRGYRSKNVASYDIAPEEVDGQ